MSFKYLCIDFGGVLCHHGQEHGRRCWERRLGLRTGELADVVFQSREAQAALVGAASEDDIWSRVASQFSLAEAECEQLSNDFWSGHRLNRELLNFCSEVATACSTVLVTNFWTGARQTLPERFGLDLARFRHTFISSEIGVKKPNVQFYNRVVRELRATPRECIFVDDEELNVGAAHAFGMLGVLHTSTTATIKRIRACLRSVLSVRQSS